MSVNNARAAFGKCPSEGTVSGASQSLRRCEQSQAVREVVNAVFEDLLSRDQGFAKLKNLMIYYAVFFEMKAIEVTVWCILLRLVGKESMGLRKYVEMLKMTGFYGKSMLGHSMGAYREKLLLEDIDFPQSYQSWVDTVKLPSVFSLSDVYPTYLELIQPSKRPKNAGSKNELVRQIVETDPKEDNYPVKKRRRKSSKAPKATIVPEIAETNAKNTGTVETTERVVDLLVEADSLFS